MHGTEQNFSFVPKARPEQGPRERASHHLRRDPVLHRGGRDEPSGNPGHHAIPHHLRGHRVRLLRPLHAVRPQPKEVGKVKQKDIKGSLGHRRNHITKRNYFLRVVLKLITVVNL